MTVMITHDDCEMVVDGFLRQPLNSLTALALVIAGLLVLTRTRMAWVGWGLIATGIGSFIFHGPMPSWGEWIHDVTLAWLILMIAGIGRPWEKATRLPGLVTLCVLLAFAPGMGDPLAAGLTVVGVINLLAHDRSGRTLGPLMFLAAVAILGRMGSTDGPWCTPESVWQLHGLWHVGAATAVAWWALGWESTEIEPVSRP